MSKRIAIIGAGPGGYVAAIHAHPTLAEVMLEASFKSLGCSLHG